jgi:hypothetical protein
MQFVRRLQEIVFSRRHGDSIQTCGEEASEIARGRRRSACSLRRGVREERASPASEPMIPNPRMRSLAPISAFMKPCVSSVVAVRNTEFIGSLASRSRSFCAHRQVQVERQSEPWRARAARRVLRSKPRRACRELLFRRMARGVRRWMLATVVTGGAHGPSCEDRGAINCKVSRTDIRAVDPPR